MICKDRDGTDGERGQNALNRRLELRTHILEKQFSRYNRI